MLRRLHGMAARVAIVVAAAVPFNAAAAVQIITHTVVTEIGPDITGPIPGSGVAAAGGRVNRLATTIDGSIFYAASEWGGLFKSLDKGKTWEHLPTHRPYVTWDVEVDPAAGTVYASSFYDGRVQSLAGINISHDAGATWQHVDLQVPTPGSCDPVSIEQLSAYGIAIDPDQPGRVAVGTSCGLAITHNGGVDWELLDPAPDKSDADVWDVVIHDGGIVDVVGSFGTRRLPSGAAQWVAPSVPVFVSLEMPGTIAVSPHEPDVLFITVSRTLWESMDGGDTWTGAQKVNPNLTGWGGRIPFVVTNERSPTVFDLWYGDVNLFRAQCTTPADPTSAPRCPANNWVANLDQGAHTDAGDLLFDPKPQTSACPLVYASDGGVHVNTLLTSGVCQTPVWQQPEVGPHALWVFSIAQADTPAGPRLYMGLQDNGAAAARLDADPEPDWFWRSSGDVFDVVTEPGRVVFSRCCQPYLLYRSSDQMANRVEVDWSGLGDKSSSMFEPIVARFGTGGYVLVTKSGAYVTDDIAASNINWTPLAPNSFPDVLGKVTIRWSTSGGVVHFFAHVIENEPEENGLWHLAGPGGTWTAVSTPGQEGGFGVFDVDPNHPDHIIASHLRPGLDPQMMMTETGGASWNPMSDLDGLMQGGGEFRYRNDRGPGDDNYRLTGYVQPTLVAFDPSDSQIVAAGSADAGLFLSADGGKQWSKVENPAWLVQQIGPTPHMPRPRVAAFDHVSTGLFSERVDVYVGTRGRGVFRVEAKVPKLNLVSACLANPAICHPIAFDPVALLFPEVGPREILTLPFGTICPSPCGGRGDPPFYNVFLDGIDTEQWEVAVFSPEGNAVPHRLARTAVGVVLTFQPDAAAHAGGAAGEYRVAFARNGDSRAAATRVGYRVEAGEPYEITVRDEIIR